MDGVTEDKGPVGNVISAWQRMPNCHRLRSKWEEENNNFSKDTWLGKEERRQLRRQEELTSSFFKMVETEPVVTYSG